MSQEKAQLIAPQGHFTVPGLNVAGVVTATSFSGNCTGTASSITKGASLVVGVMTATSFVGDVTGNVTGIGSNTDNLDVGIVTATSFAGNFTGIGSGLTGTPNVVAGVVTATKFVGNTPGTVSKLADGTNINVGVITATKFVGNTPGLAGGISAAQNINVGVLTATGGLFGDGSGLTGAGSTAFIRQTVTASSTGTINLNNGNIVYFVHDQNRTLSFSNVGTVENVTIIRTLTDYTITWPAAVKWTGGTTPTLLGNNPRSPSAAQIFHLNTCDGGTTWYAYEQMSNSPLYWTGFKVFHNNSNGVFGNNNTTDSSGNDSLPGMTPIDAFQSTNITKFGQISGQASTMHAINAADKTLWGVGSEEHWGVIGNNSRNGAISSPVQIPGTTWRSIYTGQRGAIATKTDGTLWMWGWNQQGGLGQNNTTAYSSPVQVGSGTDWAAGPRAISFGPSHAGAVKTDGTLWMWGQNDKGCLGINLSGTGFPGYNNSQSSPRQVPGTTWSKVEARGRWTIALKTDGTMWSWGYGAFGKMGHSNQSTYSSPVQIPGTTWRSFDRHTYHSNADSTLATKTDGTLWGWGYNSSGEIAQNNRTQYDSPVQIPGTTWSEAVSMDGTYGASAIKTDGTLWAWGQTGLLKADNSTYWNQFSSPVQIGSGTSWDTTDGRVIKSGSAWIAVQSI